MVPEIVVLYDIPQSAYFHNYADASGGGVSHCFILAMDADSPAGTSCSDDLFYDGSGAGTA